MILIPGSEFDVLKKLWRIVQSSWDWLVGRLATMMNGMEVKLLLKIIMMAPTLIQSQHDRWLLEQVLLRVIKKVYSGACCVMCLWFCSVLFSNVLQYVVVSSWVQWKNSFSSKAITYSVMVLKALYLSKRSIIKLFIFSIFIRKYKI